MIKVNNKLIINGKQKEVDKIFKEINNFQKIVKMPLYADVTEKTRENWREKNWDTPCKPKDIEMNFNEITFTTEHKTPYKVIKALAEKHEDVEIKLQYASENLNKVGEIVFNTEKVKTKEFAKDTKSYQDILDSLKINIEKEKGMEK